MRIAAVATALSLVAVFAYAENLTTLTSRRQPPPESGLTLHVTARETVVDVTVTDSHGNPIHDLKREDFTIKEDGKPQPLRSFQEYGGVVVAASAVARPPKLPPHVYTNLQPPADGPINILLLDETNTAPDIDTVCPFPLPNGLLCTNQAFEIQHLVRQEVIKYIQTMPVGMRVVLVAAVRGHLRLLQGVTSDRELLVAAASTLDSETEVVGKGFGFLNDVASIASGIKGRKNLLWFTYGTARYTEPEICHCDITPFLRAASQLTEAQVTIYPIDARGVYYLPNNNLSAVTVLALGGEVLSQETIAEAGGGIAYHDSNDLKSGIAHAIDAGSHYYTLSYATPDKEYDGRHHSISIKLNSDRPGLHLTYRDYYYSEDPTTALPKPQFSLLSEPASTGNMAAAMNRSIPVCTGLLFDAQVEPSTEPAKSTDPAIFGILDVKYKSKPLTRYGVEFAFPARQIAFTSGPDNTHRGGLEFDLAAYDADGKLINSLSQTIQLPLSDSTWQQMQKGPFRFFQQLDLPPGEVFLRVGIRDLTSNKIGTLEVPLNVPKSPPDRAAAAPAN